MTIKLEPMRQSGPPPERQLWALQRAGTTAHALVREWPHGDELCVFVDGVLRWARLYRVLSALEAEAAAKRHALEAIGFTPAE